MLNTEKEPDVGVTWS